MAKEKVEGSLEEKTNPKYFKKLMDFITKDEELHPVLSGRLGLTQDISLEW